MTTASAAALSAAGPVGATGYRAGLPWASPDAAARVARCLTGAADIVRSPHHRAAWARDVLGAPPILRAVRQMLGGAVAVVEPTLLMAKQPGRFAVPPHQDGRNAGFDLDPDRAVSVWSAISAATPANGCVQVVPGSHRGGYLPHVRGGAEGGRGAPLTLASPPPEDAYEPISLDAGQALLMDVRLIHRSGPNTTRTARIGLNACYVAPGGVQVRGGPPPRLYPVAANWPTHRF